MLRRMMRSLLYVATSICLLATSDGYSQGSSRGRKFSNQRGHVPSNRSVLNGQVVVDEDKRIVKPEDAKTLEEYLEKTLKVDDVTAFHMSLKIAKILQDVDTSNELVRQEIFDEFFSKHSAKTLNQIMQSVTKRINPNAIIAAPPGSGKTFLTDMLTFMLSHNVYPPYIAEELGMLKDDAIFKRDFANFAGKTNIVIINQQLLSKFYSDPLVPWPSDENRQRATFNQLFSVAEREFKNTQRRTIFVLEEMSSLPPFVQEALKTITDKAGYNPHPERRLSKIDPGYSVIGFDDPKNIDKLMAGDTAISSRYDRFEISVLTDEQVFEIGKERALYWGFDREVEVDDEAIRALMRYGNLIDNPVTANPRRILNAINGIISWKALNPGDNPRKIIRSDVMKFIVHRLNLPADMWLEGPNGEPPLEKLAAKVKEMVVGHDEVIDGVAEIIKRWFRFEFGRNVPIIAIAGPSGAGKDTIIKAFSIALFGHDGSHLMFDMGGANSQSMDAMLTGRSTAGGVTGKVVERLRSGKGHGMLWFNEVNDMPSEEIDKFKPLFDLLVIKSFGKDRNDYWVNFPIILSGQFGDHLEPENRNDAYERAKNLTDEELLKKFTVGKIGNDRVGAFSPAIIGRIMKTGGLFSIAPVPYNLYPHIVRGKLNETIKYLNDAKGIDLVVQDDLINYIAKLAENAHKDPRALQQVLAQLTLGSLSKAMDQGLPDSSLVILSLEVTSNKKRNVVVVSPDFELKIAVNDLLLPTTRRSIRQAAHARRQSRELVSNNDVIPIHPEQSELPGNCQDNFGNGILN